MRFGLAITACSLVALLCSCKGESALPIVRMPSYQEVMSTIKQRPSEELEKIYEGCPRPNGVFDNLAVGKKTWPGLSQYFLVRGFQVPATHYPGGREGDAPVPVVASPIDILGRAPNEFWEKGYQPLPSERFTLELRPLTHGRFRIVVHSSKGVSGEAEGYLNLSGEGNRCENGVLKVFWRKYDKTVPGWELYVESATGDVVMAYNTAKERGEISYRFKRISK